MFRMSRTALVLALLAAITSTPTARAAGNPSATGHGNALVDGELRTFSFAAVTQNDGTATGQAVVINRAQESRTHIEIVCLNVIGDRAYLGGYITGSDVDSEVGLPVIFAVEDNGQGAGADADVMTLVLVGDPGDVPDCHDPVLVELLDSYLLIPVEEGNIQVRP